MHFEKLEKCARPTFSAHFSSFWFYLRIFCYYLQTQTYSATKF